MNHLAHARLAGPESLDIAANLMGDFVRGRLGGRFPERVEAGLRLHRAIDVHTDDHPLHRQSRERLAPPFRRFAPILVDIYYDHFLARHFRHFHGKPVTAFTPVVYTSLERHVELLPPRLRRLVPIWRRSDLLAGYADLEVIDEVFAGISRRLTRRNPLPEGGLPLRDDYAGFEADFLEFYPALVEFAQRQRAAINRSLGIRP